MRSIAESRACVRYVGLVRFDAFGDIGGQQSYSVCLLDAEKNGVLLTYLTGRNSTRSYAVPIAGGGTSRELSDEEKRALREALSDKTPEPGERHRYAARG